LGARIVDVPARGYGAAMQAGIEAASMADMVAMRRCEAYA
jgi:hypothetical protein